MARADSDLSVGGAAQVTDRAESLDETRRAPTVLSVAAVVVGVLFVSPFVFIVWRNIDLGLSGLWRELFSRRTLEPLARSLWLAFSVSVTTMVVGLLLAWFLTRTDVVGRKFLRVLAPLPLVFPSFVGATALVAGFAPGGLVQRLLEPFGVGTLPNFRGFVGAWLVLVLFTYPYVYLPAAARVATLSQSLQDSARLLGRGPVGTFVSVVVPQSLTAVLAGGLLVFLYTISDFGAVTLLGYDTLTEQIYANRLFDQRRAMALSLVLAVCAVFIVAADRRLTARRERPVAVDDSVPVRVGLGRWRWPTTLAVGAFIANALLGPLLVLGWWAWRGIRANSATVGLGIDFGDLVGPALRSAGISAVTAVVAIGVVLPVAWITARYRSRAGEVSSTTMAAGFALPGLVVAISVVFVAINVPLLRNLYQTLWLLVFAYVAHFGAQALRSARVAVEANPVSVGEAASTLGARRLRRFAAVDVPLMTPGLVAGGSLVLLSVMKELPATLLLAPIGFDTLATEIWHATETGAWSQAGLASLVLVAVAGLLTGLAGLISRRS